MRKLTTFFLIGFLLSCGNNDKEPTDNNNNTLVTISPQSQSNGYVAGNDWEKFENDVFSTIEAIENSDSANRKELLKKFIGYGDKVDGAISEAYGYFAFNYVEEKSSEFYSVLELEDSTIIDVWAYHAALEATLGIEEKAEAESFIKDYKKKYQSKINSLPALKQPLGNLYLDKFIRHYKKAVDNYFSG